MNGIAIFGLNGSGKSTLCHALAKKIGYFEMDAEDYYFPEQKASRQASLEHISGIESEPNGQIPFTVSKTKQEAEAAVSNDIRIHPQFILSGVTVNWSEEILSHIDIAFLVEVPLAERLRRIRMREEARFGARVLPGGDMYERQASFHTAVEKRTLESVKESAVQLVCPIITLDGMQPIETNLKIMIRELSAHNVTF